MSTSKVNEGPSRGVIQRMRGYLTRFARNRDGATAIEFGFLAIPFAALTFAILESCIHFATQEVLANATDDIARQIRTGRLKKADVTVDSLRQAVCDRLEIIVASGCPSNPDLVVELQNSETFKEAAENAKLTMRNNVSLGGALTINTLRVSYRLPVITDFLRMHMSTDGKTLLFSTTTWRNEPFDE
jgi:Flp pilus assembly protein TadG